MLLLGITKFSNYQNQLSIKISIYDEQHIYEMNFEISR